MLFASCMPLLPQVLCMSYAGQPSFIRNVPYVPYVPYVRNVRYGTEKIGNSCVFKAFQTSIASQPQTHTPHRLHSPHSGPHALKKNSTPLHINSTPTPQEFFFQLTLLRAAPRQLEMSKSPQPGCGENAQTGLEDPHTSAGNPGTTPSGGEGNQPDQAQEHTCERHPSCDSVRTMM